MPKLSEFLFGKKAKNKQLKTVSPEQEQLMALITEGLTSGKGPLQDIFGGFNQQEFDAGVTQPALKNFKENILPMLQEKFIAGNQVGGSGMQNAQMKAGADLQSQLAQLMYQAQQQQKQNRFGGIQQLLGTKTFENVYRPEREGFVPGVWKGFASGLGQGIGNMAFGGLGSFGGGGGGLPAGTPSASNAAKTASAVIAG